MLASVVSLGDLGHPHGNAAADLHVLQLVLAGSQGLVQGHGVVGAPGVVHPVAGLDQLSGLFGGGQLALVHSLKIHFLVSFSEIKRIKKHVPHQVKAWQSTPFPGQCQRVWGELIRYKFSQESRKSQAKFCIFCAFLLHSRPSWRWLSHPLKIAFSQQIFPLFFCDSLPLARAGARQ